MRLRNITGPIALLAPFLVGQGSVFCLSIWLLSQQHYQAAASLVLTSSLCSFAFQFADFATTSRALKLVLDGDRDEIQKFRKGRGILAVLVCWIVSVALLVGATKLPAGHILGVSILLSLAAFIFGHSRYPELEAKKRFLSVAILQCLPWLIFILAWVSHDLVRVDVSESRRLYVIAAAVLFAAAASHIVQNLLLRDDQIPASRFSWIECVRSVWPYLLGQLIGQAWGRILLLLLTQVLTTQALGAFGPVRQLQIGLLLVFGAVLRSTIRNLLPNIRSGSDEIDLLKWSAIRQILAFSLLVPMAALVLLLARHFSVVVVDSVYIYWLPLLIFAPAIVCIQVLQMQSHINGWSTLTSRAESSSLAVNAIVFSSLVLVAPNWAVAIAESSPALNWLFWIKLGRRK